MINFTISFWLSWLVEPKTMKNMDKAGVILYMHPANERQCYNVTLSLIGQAHTQNDESTINWKNIHNKAKQTKLYANSMGYAVIIKILEIIQRKVIQISVIILRKHAFIDCSAIDNWFRIMLLGTNIFMTQKEISICRVMIAAIISV